MKIIHESGLSINTKTLDLQSNMTRGQDDNYIYYVPEYIYPWYYEMCLNTIFKKKMYNVLT